MEEARGPSPPRVVPAHEIVGSGPRLALVPGTFSDRRVWLRLVGALSPRFACLMLDPRGTGETPDPGAAFSPDDLVDDLLAAMDAAAFDRAHLIGHSLGASVALLAAARHPGRVGRIVAVSPAPHADARVRAVLDHWEALARSDLSAAALHLGLVLPAFGRDAFDRLVPAVIDDMNQHPLDRDTVVRYVECDRRQDLRPHLGRIDAAVLVVAGAEDTLTGPGPAREVADALPDARFEVISGCGHTPQVERPAELARLVTCFLGAGRRR
jgi:pimeloyl-ACP methyl ester carboxylesterase